MKATDITQSANGTAGSVPCRVLAQVRANGHSVMLPEAGLASVEIKHEAAAQSGVLELGFDLWAERGSRQAA